MLLRCTHEEVEDTWPKDTTVTEKDDRNQGFHYLVQSDKNRPE